MRHRLYNGKLNGKLNHIGWGKEIVKTVHPQLHGNCKTNDMSEVNIVTIEAHVLSDNRLQQCQRHQTDIRTHQSVEALHQNRKLMALLDQE